MTVNRSLDEIRAALDRLPDGLITEADVAAVGVSREEWDAVADADEQEHYEQLRAERERDISAEAEGLDATSARAIVAEDRKEREHGCNMSVENCADCSSVERRGMGEVEAREITLAAARRVIAADTAAGSPRHPALAAAAAMQPPSVGPGSTAAHSAPSPQRAATKPAPPPLRTGAPATHRPPTSRT